MSKCKCFSLVLASLVILSFVASGCVKKPLESQGREETRPQVTYIYHKVKYPGETLALIAAWYTGAAKNWEIIQAHNPGMDVRKIRIGDVILIPHDLVVKETPMPEDFVQKASRRPPRPEPKLAQEKVVTPEEVKEKTITEEPLEPFPPAVEASAAPSVAVREPMATVQQAPTPPPTASGSMVTLPAPNLPAPTAAATPERKLKTRDELLKELLEE